MTIKFYNSNDEFGDAGPHDAESKEELADEMAELFVGWVQSEWDDEERKRNELGELWDDSRDEDVWKLEAMCKMRAEFIDGLEAQYHGEPRIIFDNGGGITIQLTGYAHHYDAGSVEQCADDLAEWISDDEDTSGWDGNEEEAVFEPTADQISSGGYRVETVDDFMSLIYDMSWGNIRDLHAALTKKVLD